jgi:hypothetical protein
MITDQDMHDFAGFLAAWCESKMTARKALAHGDDNHQRETKPQTHRQRPRCRTIPTKDRESS